MDSDQQNKVTGADGIMQLLKKTAMGVLANLEPNNDADKKILYVLEPYLKQAAGLSETIRDIRNNLVESTKIYIRPNSTLQKANPAKEAMRIKIEIADKQKHLKNQRDNILIPKAVELLRKTELLKVPTLSIALGVLYLAQLCEKNKDSSGVVDLKGALNDYSGSEKSNFYFPRIMTMMKIVSEYTGAVPLMVTENVHERLNIETALKLVMKDPAFLQEIIDHKRTPDDGIRYLKALVKFENAEKEANRAVEATSEQKPKIEIVAVKTKHVVRHKVTPHTATANHRHHPASQARHVSHRKNH